MNLSLREDISKNKIYVHFMLPFKSDMVIDIHGKKYPARISRCPKLFEIKISYGGGVHISQENAKYILI
jgi:hypothetical protein